MDVKDFIEQIMDHVPHGRMKATYLFEDYFGICSIAELEALLVGCLHKREALAKVLKELPLDEFMLGVDMSILLDYLHKLLVLDHTTVFSGGFYALHHFLFVAKQARSTGPCSHYF